MRLFRRTLLCVVVSVTAFGAAGWGFRPRANWQIDGDELGCQPVIVERDYSRKAPDECWLCSVRNNRMEIGVDVRSRACRVNLKTGAILQRVHTPDSIGGMPIVRSDGKLLFVSRFAAFTFTLTPRLTPHPSVGGAAMSAKAETSSCERAAMKWVKRGLWVAA
jgi:hypothetical protein